MKMVSDFKDRQGKWVSQFKFDGLMFRTRAASLWYGLKVRCTKKFQDVNPSYKGCVNKFTDFQEFAEWCQLQIGYGCDNYHLDKDILSKGGKEYSKEACVFVPLEINYLFTKRQLHRGGLPLGVTLNCVGNFTANVKINGVQSYIGTYKSVHEAFIAYKTSKEKVIRSVAEDWKGEIDSRVYDAMLKYVVEITD